MAKYARGLLGSTIAGIAGLLAFAAPTPHQRIVSADEISARAWGRTGASLRKAMKAVDTDAAKSGTASSSK